VHQGRSGNNSSQEAGEPNGAQRVSAEVTRFGNYILLVTILQLFWVLGSVELYSKEILFTRIRLSALYNDEVLGNVLNRNRGANFETFVYMSVEELGNIRESGIISSFSCSHDMKCCRW